MENLSAKSTLFTDAQKSDFFAEFKRLENILAVHHKHIEKARQQAERLAQQAAETTDDGIKDLVDEDGEVDAAIRASLVRQASDRAMHAVRRLRQLEDLGSALAFGHTTDQQGRRHYVGRHSVIEGDEALLVDWRAAAAMPFYRATYGDPLGMVRRRHLLYEPDDVGQSQNFVDFSDELLTADGGDTAHLRGEAALLASVEAPTDKHMRSVVATIQAEQDAVIRAPSNEPLVVQGGPGTGKTVVALHRAAYLLYNHRLDLEESGVLVVGPTKEFLAYIARVLPSLGESGVVSLTADRLYQGVRLGFDESLEAATFKGERFMADVLVKALRDRQRPPTGDLVVWYGSTRRRINESVLRKFFFKAQRHQHHNEGAGSFRRMVIEALTLQTFSPSFDSADEVRDAFRSSPEVKEFLLKCWPPLTAEQALNDLYGSRALLRSALTAKGSSAERNTAADIELLYRERSGEACLTERVWSSGDVALLDELSFLLNGSVGDIESERVRRRDALSEFELALVEGKKDHEVDLHLYQSESDIDPIEPSGYWRSSDTSLELFPIMYDQAEEKFNNE